MIDLPSTFNHHTFSTLLLLCSPASSFTFAILASKRQGRHRSKSRIRSKSRSRSGSRAEQRKQRPIFSHFVVPLAGLLSAFTARLYDMGETSTSQARVDEVDERAPLLGGSQNEHNEPEAPPKKVGKWVIRNAVIISVSLLILAVIIVLCIFFASKLHQIILEITGQSDCVEEQSLTSI